MESNSISLPPPAETSPNWPELPPELTASILLRVGIVDVLLSAWKVCKTWRRICSDPSMWRVVELRPSGQLFPRKLEYVARQAVDLSCGQLIQLDISLFGNHHDLLRYISDRSSQMRRLHLGVYNRMMNDGLSEMVKKLPLLEELQLNCIDIPKQAIEVAGRSCPHLKSFELFVTCFACTSIECDEYALSIAENMPGLRHLKFFVTFDITSDGLLAILENCPHLESLDMRLNVAKLGPDLVKRLFQQIKDLRLSYLSTKDDISDDEIYNSDSFDEDDPSGLSDINTVSDDSDYYDDE